MSPSLHRYEHKVTSQNGEDGVLDFLIHHVPLVNTLFIEIGLQTYQECNTRALVSRNRAYGGLIIEGNPDDCAVIRHDPLYWRRPLHLVNEYVRHDTCNALFEREGLSGDIALLSIDVDGQDYYLWQAVQAVSPRIVIIEMQGRYGNRFARVMPCDPEYRWRGETYGGASIAALHHLGLQKGYSLVHVESSGVNAFFVRDDALNGLDRLEPWQAFMGYHSAPISRDTVTLPMIDLDHGSIVSNLAAFDVFEPPTIT